MTQPTWQAGRFRIDLSTPKIMGIINLTPDSFSDGGTYSRSSSAALAHAERLLAEGAHILDIGGESTRPGAAHVSPEEEWARLQPIVSDIIKWDVPLSVDTRRSAIMQRLLGDGLSDIINDISALADGGAIELLAAHPDTGICLMHMQGLPETMQNNPQYQDVVAEVAGYLKARAQTCQAAGIRSERIVLDPGIGFGKNLQHNIQLMRHLPDLQAQTGLSLLIGISRKRMIGEITGETDPTQRIHGSVAAALYAAERGAAILRVHDVKATADALKVWQALH